jgi:hemerythrin-like metal-binding protein
MNPMIWKPEYSIRDARVDSQHERLFLLYNQIAAMTHGSGEQERLIRELYKDAVLHFAEEEALMATVNYPEKDFERHRRSHQLFFRTVKRLGTQSAETALDFFREWLVRHILSEDQDVGRFLQGRTREGG